MSTNYGKHTVKELKEVLKQRGIAQTGLSKKAQIIERLEQDDAERAGAEEDAAPEVEEAELTKEAAPDEAPEKETAPATQEEEVVEAQPEAQPEPQQAEGVGEAAQREEQSSAEVSVEATQESEPVEAETERVIPETQAVPEPSPTPQPTQPAVAEPAVETETVDFAQTKDGAKTPPAAPDERPSVEVLDVPEQAPDAASTVSGVSQLGSEEAEADRRKRKRRSQTPDMPAEVVAKKARASEGVAEAKGDDDVVMEEARPEEKETTKLVGGMEVEVVEVPKEPSGEAEAEAPKEASREEESEFAAPDAKDASEVTDLPVPEEQDQSAADKAPREKERRYKDIFQPAPSDAVPQTEELDRDVTPALHAATPALYIRNLMRPLKAPALESHLITLASPPSASPNPSLLQKLFLDNMKTHALALFSSTAAASRVRANLHNVTWPPEGQRKALFVDFVPADKVTAWIIEEEDQMAAEKDARAAGRPIAAKRFEVVYPTTADGAVEAVFQEVGSAAPFNAPRGPRAEDPYRRPSSPTLSRHQPPGADAEDEALPAPAPPAEDLGKSFQTLDQLFSSTTAKPRLYYLPVADDISERRLDDLAAETSRDWAPGERVRGRTAGALNKKVRYSFDKGDRVVEVGADFGPWTAREEGGPGGFRGGRGGGGYGGFRSDRGVGWRGGDHWGGPAGRGRGRGGFRERDREGN